MKKNTPKNLILSICLCLILILFSSAAHAVMYSYDELNRLEKTEYETGQSLQYEYDANGNILSIQSVEKPVAVAEASDISNTGFTANWSAIPEAETYRLDVSTTSDFSSYLPGYEDLTVSGITQTVSELSSGTTYYYRVRAVTADGTGCNSQVIEVTTTSDMCAILAGAGEGGSISPYGNTEVISPTVPT